nr:hypothetical protein Iba_chr04fCG12520 [Ipomoea batatas]
MIFKEKTNTILYVSGVVEIGFMEKGITIETPPGRQFDLQRIRHIGFILATALSSFKPAIYKLETQVVLGLYIAILNYDRAIAKDKVYMSQSLTNCLPSLKKRV